MEWPTPGLWPDAVGRKSSTYSILLDHSPPVSFPRATPAAFKPFLVPPLLHFLHSRCFKCLAPTHPTSLHRIKTRRKTQAQATLVLFAITQSKWEREREGMENHSPDWLTIDTVFCEGFICFLLDCRIYRQGSEWGWLGGKGLRLTVFVLSKSKFSNWKSSRWYLFL